MPIKTSTKEFGQVLGLAAAIYVTTGLASAEQPKNPPTNLVTVTSKDTSRMAWAMFEIPQTGAKIPVKFLEADKETGMMALLVRYPAGFKNKWHTHPHAHGMYVLDGVLKTHEGEYGPGSWVWFSEGGWMEHGATAITDVTFLFFTNKKFDIKYETDSEPWYPLQK